MTETKPTLEPLRAELLSELVDAGGPCLTLVTPPHRPGDPSQPAVLPKTDLEEATAQLAARKVSADTIAQLLRPLRELIADEGARGTDSVRILFRSRDNLREVELPMDGPMIRMCIAGDCYFLRPMISALSVPDHLYVLEITKKDAALMSCGGSGLLRCELPKGTPHTIDDVTGFDPPDHDLMNRSAAGPSSGAMAGVQFGTGSEREKAHAHLHDFYRAVDRGLNELVGSNPAPVILAGVDEDIALYRAASTYPVLLRQSIPTIPAGHKHASAADIWRRARHIARFDSQERAAASLSASAERLAPARFSTDLDVILQAAAQGRIIDLYLDENGRRMGDFDGKVFGGRNNWRGEELLNVAAVETLRHGGHVYSLPTHLMTNRAFAAAAFRY